MNTTVCDECGYDEPDTSTGIQSFIRVIINRQWMDFCSTPCLTTALARWYDSGNSN